jgi:hypothetical protein
MISFDSDKLRLTDFMDLPTLQEIQDSFAAVANVKATITDAEGQLLTQPTPTKEFIRRQMALAADEDAAPAADGREGPQKEGAEYVAPIIVNNQRVGTIRMTANGALSGIDDGKLNALAAKAGIEIKQLRSVAQSLLRANNRGRRQLDSFFSSPMQLRASVFRSFSFASGSMNSRRFTTSR